MKGALHCTPSLFDVGIQSPLRLPQASKAEFKICSTISFSLLQLFSVTCITGVCVELNPSDVLLFVD